MNNKVVLMGLGLVVGLFVGIGLTWYTTSNFTTQAIIEAEIKFNELLEVEKSKYSSKISSLERTKSNLEYTLVSTEMFIDSLNTTISNRGKELNQIKKKYNEKLSSIDGMSHNELTNFFSKRYQH